ncbi:MAG: hypothetical protein J6C37_07720 [Roseburia sp.]|nr:hypothetical protein [Roseburia sp.]
MKKTITYDINKKKVQREVNYIPFRYILAILITLFEALAVIGTINLDYRSPVHHFEKRSVSRCDTAPLFMKKIKKMHNLNKTLTFGCYDIK